MTMSFIHAADLHLGYRQYGLDERFRDFGASFLDIARHAIEKKAKFVLIAGDLFDKKSISAATFTQARQVLATLKEAGIQCIAIEGNHDRYFNGDEMSWLEALEYEGLLKLIKPGVERLMENYVDIDDTRIFGLCYAGSMTAEAIPRVAEEIRYFNAESAPAYTILMMHLGVQGKMKYGMSGDVSLEDLEPLKECVDYLALGHYHNAFEIDGWVFNPGSPEICSVTEAGEPKGFYLVVDKKPILVDSLKRKFILLDIRLDNVMDCASLSGIIEKQLTKEHEKPVVIVTLKGVLNFDRSLVDMEGIKQNIIAALDPLYVDVRLDLSNDEFAVYRPDVDGFDRKAIERSVFDAITSMDSMLSGHSGIAGLIGDVKDMALAGSDAASLDKTVRAVFDKIMNEPVMPEKAGAPAMDGSGNDDWDWRPKR